MATYDYECKDCGVMEIQHGMNEKNKTECPKCGKDGLEKKIVWDNRGIHFKGAGFYSTDNRLVDKNIKDFMPTDPTKKKFY